jgi:hypothetical protein
MSVPAFISAAAAEGRPASALPLITLDAADKFAVHAPALAYLRSLTGKVAVVTIAGAFLLRANGAARRRGATRGGGWLARRGAPPASHPLIFSRLLPSLSQACTARASRTC